ncbi:putative quinol monooxygenase [Corynebacterium breve]|uniref:Quinol monooxygenase n=1 Tax=Corynebacterium breve TaxID=3049799 RepID=A0ABY8VH83_9CORY|nr:putative quinol monooxygenase [Corynebacterium breve]WIM68447.1 putative quinol monooxygenase [Corynebacterium breve]
MILINVRFLPLPEYVENFREKVAEFTEASRAEDGCLFFDWFRSTDRPDEYILVESFKDDAAEAHVESDHFRAAQELFPTLLRETPTIINTLIPGKTEWDEMAEFQVEK